MPKHINTPRRTSKNSKPKAEGHLQIESTDTSYIPVRRILRLISFISRAEARKQFKQAYPKLKSVDEIHVYIVIGLKKGGRE